MRFERLSQENFAQFCAITKEEGGGGCYCSFWHQGMPMKEWQNQCQNDPERNKEAVLSALQEGKHIGVLVYQEEKLLGWVSVGPVREFIWATSRAQALGEDGKTVAVIMCFAIHPENGDKGMQLSVLENIPQYAKAQGWTILEGYPFDDAAHEAHPNDLVWPGYVKPFESAGFICEGKHWLSQPTYERWIYRQKIH